MQGHHALAWTRFHVCWEGRNRHDCRAHAQGTQIVDNALGRAVEHQAACTAQLAGGDCQMQARDRQPGAISRRLHLRQGATVEFRQLNFTVADGGDPGDGRVNVGLGLVAQGIVLQPDRQAYALEKAAARAGECSGGAAVAMAAANPVSSERRSKLANIA